MIFFPYSITLSSEPSLLPCVGTMEAVTVCSCHPCARGAHHLLPGLAAEEVGWDRRGQSAQLWSLLACSTQKLRVWWRPESPPVAAVEVSHGLYSFRLLPSAVGTISVPLPVSFLPAQCISGRISVPFASSFLQEAAILANGLNSWV